MTYECPCGKRCHYLVRHRGFWARFGWLVLTPIFSAVYYVLGIAALAAGAGGKEFGMLVIGIALIGVPVVGSILVTALDRHRGWCFVRKTFRNIGIAPVVLFRFFADVS